MDIEQQLDALAKLGTDMLRRQPKMIGAPYHAVTGAPYRGLNALILLATRIDVKDHGYVTQNDIEIHQGELVDTTKGTRLWLYSGGTLSPYTIFPLEDTSNLERYQEQTQWTPLISRVDSICDWFQNAGQWPQWIDDHIQSIRRDYGFGQTPKGKTWQDPSWALTELATVIVYRLRDLDQLDAYHPQRQEGRSSNPRYETLVAEIGGAMLAAHLGFAFKPTNRDDDFVPLMQDNPNVLRAAALDAQLVMDFLDNKVYDAMAEREIGSRQS